MFHIQTHLRHVRGVGDCPPALDQTAAFWRNRPFKLWQRTAVNTAHIRCLPVFGCADCGKADPMAYIQPAERFENLSITRDELEDEVLVMTKEYLLCTITLNEAKPFFVEPLGANAGAPVRVRCRVRLPLGYPFRSYTFRYLRRSFLVGRCN